MQRLAVHYRGERVSVPAGMSGLNIDCEPIRQLTKPTLSSEDTGTTPSNRALVRSTNLCGLSSGAYAVPRQPHNPRTCATEATPPASKCASATAFTSSIAAPASACSASNCKANLATALFRPRLRLALSLGSHSGHAVLPSAVYERGKPLSLPVLQPNPQPETSSGRSDGRAIFSRGHRPDEGAPRFLRHRERTHHDGRRRSDCRPRG